MNSVNLLLCHHIPERADIVAAMVVESKSGIIALEAAYDDTDPTTDPRLVIGSIQHDLMEYCTVGDPLEVASPDGFYGSVVRRVQDLGARVLPFIVDNGRTVFTQQDLDEVLSVVREDVLIADIKEHASKPDEYLLRRAERLAESFSVRESVVVEQIFELRRCFGERLPIALIMGADHYPLHYLLEQRGIPTAQMRIDSPSPMYELPMSVLIRFGGVQALSQHTLAVKGTADLLYFTGCLNEEPPQITPHLRSFTYAALCRVAEAASHNKLDDSLAYLAKAL